MKKKEEFSGVRFEFSNYGFSVKVCPVALAPLTHEAGSALGHRSITADSW